MSDDTSTNAGAPSDRETPAAAIKRITETAAAKLSWAAAKTLVTLALTAMLSMVTGYVKEMRDDIKAATRSTEILHTQQELTAQRVDSLEKVTNATVATIQQLAHQVGQHDTDIGILKQAATQSALSSRPQR